MQTLIFSRGRPVGTIIVLALALLGQGCAKRTMSFPSPSHRAAVEIWQNSFDNSWGARAELITPRGRTTLIQSGRDTFLYFVHVYWSADETKVGVLARGGVRWEIGFDARINQPIPFEKIRSDFAGSMATLYNLAQGTDPIDWADSSEASQAFFKLHPEIHVTYHH
jgi:hypothetical protein